MNDIVFYALLATLGTWLVTALGAATVVLFKSPNPKILNLMLGFAAGVMVAASFWSLLQPAIERAEAAGSMPAFLVATLGFLCGALFMWGSDKCVSYARGRSAWRRARKRTAEPHHFVGAFHHAHQYPGGVAVGVAFGALKNGGYTPEALMGAVTVAVGIGLQNFPEGAAVSLPLRREGCSRRKSFFIGQASGFVEPIAGVLGALLAVYIEAVLPFALSFAAGAMILVAVHELIPECQRNQKAQPYAATMGIVTGFALMMLLDVMLG